MGRKAIIDIGSNSIRLIIYKIKNKKKVNLSSHEVQEILNKDIQNKEDNSNLNNN